MMFMMLLLKAAVYVGSEQQASSYILEINTNTGSWYGFVFSKNIFFLSSYGFHFESGDAFLSDFNSAALLYERVLNS